MTSTLGKNMRHALDFFSGYPGWHSFDKARSTVAAIIALEKLGALEVNGYHQARITNHGTALAVSH